MTSLAGDFWWWVGEPNLASPEKQWVNSHDFYPIDVYPNQSRPSPRAGAMMALDRSRSELVLFGGYGIPPNGGIAQDLDDTWVFSWKNGWQGPYRPPLRPPARDDGAMTFVFQEDHVVLFGGHAPTFTATNGFASDTWSWHGDTRTWVQLTFSTGDAPYPRYGARMTGFEISGNLLFGGFGDVIGFGSGFQYLADTEFYNGRSWSPNTFASTLSPSGRAEYGIAEYDAVFPPFALLFGGERDGQHFGDTYAFTDWHYPGNMIPNVACSSTSPGGIFDAFWLRLCPTHSPSARSYHAMAYSEPDGKILLFGGWDANGNIVGSTWLWGPATTCTPDASAMLKVGTAVRCSFSPIDGTHLDGWEADGFAPKKTNEPHPQFHPEGPGPATIISIWTDAKGVQHRNGTHYTIGLPGEN
jgi:hypothetical protein